MIKWAAEVAWIPTGWVCRRVARAGWLLFGARRVELAAGFGAVSWVSWVVHAYLSGDRGSAGQGLVALLALVASIAMYDGQLTTEPLARPFASVSLWVAGPSVLVGDLVQGGSLVWGLAISGAGLAMGLLGLDRDEDQGEPLYKRAAGWLTRRSPVAASVSAHR